MVQFFPAGKTLNPATIVLLLTTFTSTIPTAWAKNDPMSCIKTMAGVRILEGFPSAIAYLSAV
jgi:hypothetical protein